MTYLIRHKVRVGDVLVTYLLYHHRVDVVLVIRFESVEEAEVS